MLDIWTTANSDLLTDVFAPALRRFRPNVPPHKFTPMASSLPLPDPGGVVLVCGTKPLHELQQAGTAPKNRAVTSMREKPLLCNGGWYLVTYDPAVVANEPDKAEIIAWDLRLATRLLRTGNTAPEIGSYVWVNNLQPLIDQIEEAYAKTGEAQDLASDLETMGFDPFDSEKDIVSISFTAKPGESQLLYLGPQPNPAPFQKGIDLHAQISWLLTSPKVKTKFANGKFDLVWIAVKWGIECTNFSFDTVLAGSLLDENRSNSLSVHTKLFTDLGGYDLEFEQTYDKSAMEGVPTQDLALYAGGDTDATYQVADVLRDQLVNDPGLAQFYINVLHPAARAFEKVERRGVVIDADKYEKLSEDLDQTVKEGQQKALALLPNKMRIKYRDKIEDQLEKGKDPLTPKILKEYFFTPQGLNLKAKETTPKTGEPSMTQSHLSQFKDHPEAAAMVDVLAETSGAEKTQSTFVRGFLKHIRSDGLLHPTYFLAHADYEGQSDTAGTVTGRLSAKGPAFQTLPKKTAWADRIRECYPAPSGKIVVVIDYSQGELRVVASVAEEKAMLQAYQEGKDLHALTGAQLSGVDYGTFLSWKTSDDAKLVNMFKDLRQQAKAGNFGLLYGMMAAGFQAYAWANYGLKLTLQEAEQIRNEFFELYSGLLDYHIRQKNIVHMHGQVRSPLGRVRHLPQIKSWDKSIRSKAERQGINSPIQSTLTDMMIWSIALIDESYPGGEIEIVGMIHDSLVAYVPESNPHHWIKGAVEIMENLPFQKCLGWTPDVAFPADAEMGPDLANLQDVKLIAD